jgi:hypothetical protein
MTNDKYVGMEAHSASIMATTNILPRWGRGCGQFATTNILPRWGRGCGQFATTNILPRWGRGRGQFATTNILPRWGREEACSQSKRASGTERWCHRGPGWTTEIAFTNMQEIAG